MMIPFPHYSFQSAEISDDPRSLRVSFSQGERKRSIELEISHNYNIGNSLHTRSKSANCIRISLVEGNNKIADCINKSQSSKAQACNNKKILKNTETPKKMNCQQKMLGKKSNLFESLLLAELSYFTCSKGSIKDSIYAIINTKDGSRFLQGLLNDLPMECFRLLFSEVSD